MVLVLSNHWRWRINGDIIRGGLHCIINCAVIKMPSVVSFGGLAVKHLALGVKGHRFDPSNRSKLFQRLHSRLTKSCVADHVKWLCPKVKGDFKEPSDDIIHHGSAHPQGISAPSFRNAPLWVVGKRLYWSSNSLGILPETQAINQASKLSVISIINLYLYTHALSQFGK